MIEFIDNVLISWKESDEELGGLGHGVDLMHYDLPRKEVIAFIDGFDGWYHPGRQARVWMLRTCPDPSIDSAHWAEIVRDARDAILTILLDKTQIEKYLRRSTDPETASGVYVALNA